MPRRIPRSSDPGYLGHHPCPGRQEPATAARRFYCDLACDPCGPFAPLADGWVDVPDRPGLGGDPDLSLIDEFRA